MTKPANRTEYWERLLKLHEKTDGHYTIRQMHDAFGMTHDEIVNLEISLDRYVLNPRHRAADLRIRAQHWATHWRSLCLSQVQFEESRPVVERLRIQAIHELMHAAMAEHNTIGFTEDALLLRQMIRRYVTLDWAYGDLRKKEPLAWFQG